MKKLFLLLGIICFLIACATARPAEPIRAEAKYFCIPEIGVETTAYIGESLITEGKKTSQMVIYLNNSYGAQGWTTFHPVGIYKPIGKTKGVLIYQYDSPDMLNFGKYPQIQEDPDGKLYLIGYSGRRLLSQSDYEKRQHTEESIDNFEQTLIYTGAEGTILKFSYREFSNNMARSAFTVDATYDIKNDKIIRFRGASLEVIRVDNQSIKYKLISGFKTDK